MHITLYRRQPSVKDLYVFESALTVIPARFADDEKLCVDSIGKKAHHKTEENGRDRIKYIGFIHRINEIGLYSCW